MPAATRNIVIEKGATFSKTLSLIDGADQAVDLTDATAQAKFRQRAQDTDSVDFTVTIDTPETDGQITWGMTANTIATLPSGKGVYDLTVTYADGTSQRLLEGTVTVKPWVGGAD